MIMNYEQRYKDALDRAKKLKETCRGTAVIGWCEYIFPELKESEDEKIRKDLIKWCEEFPDLIWRGHVKDKVLAWLKKQGEQKPVDKVAPKFKVGDWVVYNRIDHSREVIQIYDIRDNRYYFNDNFYWSVKECDDKSHLWTIEDTKDGDVLCLGDVIAIFKKYIGQEQCICYCSSCDNGGFEIPIENGEDNVYGCTNTIPATKEQRDLLFQKMKESGYEWDANKKELKKL